MLKCAWGSCELQKASKEKVISNTLKNMSEDTQGMPQSRSTTLNTKEILGTNATYETTDGQRRTAAALVRSVEKKTTLGVGCVCVCVCVCGGGGKGVGMRLISVLLARNLILNSDKLSDLG